MTQLSQDILGKIKHDHLKPVPRWHFLLKSYAFWFFLGVSILLGSLAFSVIVHIFNAGDLGMLDHLQGNLFTSAVMLLPYFWFLSLCVCELIAYFNWKHTRFGYRFRRRWIMFSSIVVSIFFGSALYALGMGQAVDNAMIAGVPFYDQSKHVARQQLWMQPDKGLLVGKVVEANDPAGNIVIKDESGNHWNVNENAIPPKSRVNVKKGKIIKIVGKKEEGSTFAAKEIRKCGDCWKDEDADSN